MTDFVNRHKFLFSYCLICAVFISIIFTRGG